MASFMISSKPEITVVQLLTTNWQIDIKEMFSEMDSCRSIYNCFLRIEMRPVIEASFRFLGFDLNNTYNIFLDKQHPISLSNTLLCKLNLGSTSLPWFLL